MSIKSSSSIHLKIIGQLSAVAIATDIASQVRGSQDHISVFGGACMRAAGLPRDQSVSQ